MKFAFTVQKSDNTNLIRACSPHEITVRDQTINDSVVLSAEELIAHWPPQNVDALTTADLDAALSLNPEVILLGTGAKQIFPAAQIMAHAQRAGVGLEVMNTPAACRTYNILLHEGRRVVAALILEKLQS